MKKIADVIDKLSKGNIATWHFDQKAAELALSGSFYEAGIFACKARKLNHKRADLREELNLRLEGRTRGTQKIEYV